MSDFVKGKITGVRKDRKGVKLDDDNWYSVRNASALGNADRGDTLEASYTQNGNWNNLDEKSIKITKGGGASSGGGGGGYKGGGSKASDFRTPDEIMRTTALECAVEFLTAGEELEPGVYADNVEKVLRTSDLFTAYIKGLIELPPPSSKTPPPPPPEPEYEPEPEEDEPTPEVAQKKSPLSSFLGG